MAKEKKLTVIAVDSGTHAKVKKHLGTKSKLGAWATEAMEEKLLKEKIK